MSRIKLVTALIDSVTNECANPSFEAATTGWTASGTNTITRDYRPSFRGGYCGTVTWFDTHDPLCYYGITGMGVPYTATLYIYVPYTWDGGDLSLEFDGANTKKDVWTSSNGYNRWVRLRTSIATGSIGNNVMLVSSSAPSSSGTGAVNIDAMNIENNVYGSDPIDGDQPRCFWLGARHLSQSVASKGHSGREYDIETDLSVTGGTIAGIGMAVPDHITSRYPMIGSTWDGFTWSQRTINIGGNLTGASITNLHAIRNTLYQVITPDRSEPPEELTVRYDTGATAQNAGGIVDFRSIYDSGMESSAPIARTEPVSIRFIANNPIAVELREESQHFTSGFSDSVANANYAIQKIGQDVAVSTNWKALSTGFNNIVWALAYDRVNNLLYAGGQFTTAGGGAANRVAVWDGTSWSALGTGMNNTVYALVVDSQGNLYAGGAFTTADGGAANRIAMWNGTSWSACTSGLNSTVTSLCLSKKQPDCVYVGGAFTTAGGLASLRFAMWRASGSWLNFASGPDATVNCLASDPAGDIYIGGQFANIGILPRARIAHFVDGSFNALGSGLDNDCNAIISDRAGGCYAGGQFTTAGGNTVNYISHWNGSSWESMGDGVGSTVHTLHLDDVGMLYIGGAFTTADNMTMAKVARWNGSVYLPIDCEFPGPPTVYAIETAYYGVARREFYGYSSSGSATSSLAQTFTVASTTKTRPVIEIRRSGGTDFRLRMIRNETTGHEIWFDTKTNDAGYAFGDGESVIIDLSKPTPMATSSVFGDITSAILPGSDLMTFALIHGDNVISTFASSNDTDIQHIRYRVIHSSADGAAS